MKFPPFSAVFCLVSVSLTYGQSGSVPRSNPSLPGYTGFHSNIGLQEIIEVGVPLSDRAKGKVPATGKSFLERVDAAVSKTAPPPKPKGPVNYSVQVGTRAYSTSNVLRQESSLAQSSGVLESNVGFAVSHLSLIHI